jgi:transposase
MRSAILLTASTEKRYGMFHGKLAKRHQRDCEKRQRKARKRGQTARTVWAASSSQCCSLCYYTSKDNRSSQQTFWCKGGGFACHADENAAVNPA